MAKILTVRLRDDLAEYLAQTAANSRMSVNKTLEALVSAARANGVTEVGMVAMVRRPTDD